MFEQFMGQFFEDIHDRVFGGLPVAQVFQADPEQQVKISLVQFPQDGQVGGLPVGGNQFPVIICVGGRGTGRYVVNKSH